MNVFEFGCVSVGLGFELLYFTQAYVCVDERAHVDMYMYMSVYLCYIYVCIYVYIYNVHIYIYIYIYIHIIYIYTYKYMHTYMHTCCGMRASCAACVESFPKA